jgi:hypothetical protein
LGHLNTGHVSKSHHVGMGQNLLSLYLRE